MESEIRAFTSADYPAVAAVRNAASPQDPTTAAYLRKSDEEKPDGVKRARWVVERGCAVVGVGEYTQSTDLYHPRKFLLSIRVHPMHQRQSIGSMLYNHLVRELQPFEPIGYQARASEDNTDALRFVAKRGFVEDFRQWESHLRVEDFDINGWRAVEDRIRASDISIVTLADLAGDVDRDYRLFDLEQEIHADVPSPDSVRNSLWPKDENRMSRYADLVLHDPERAPWTYLVAVKDGEYIGLTYGTADSEHGIFDIDVTGVRRNYRGMGVATALKVRGIAEAKSHGYQTIRTWNDTPNERIIGLNRKLGFVRQPALIFFETRAAS